VDIETRTETNILVDVATDDGGRRVLLDGGDWSAELAAEAASALAGDLAEAAELASGGDT
jgi:hypothetical protein